jgi:Tfp pilus assembly PilM family ATPase
VKDAAENILKKNAGSVIKKNEILLVAAPKNEVIRCGNLVKESGLEVKNVELELFSLVRAMGG